MHLFGAVSLRYTGASSYVYLIWEVGRDSSFWSSPGLVVDPDALSGRRVHVVTL